MRPAGPANLNSILNKPAKIAPLLKIICKNLVHIVVTPPTAVTILPLLPINALKLATIPAPALFKPPPARAAAVSDFCKPFITTVIKRRPAKDAIAIPTPVNTLINVCKPSVLAAKDSIDSAKSPTALASPSNAPVSSFTAPNKLKNAALSLVNDSPIVVVVLPKSFSTLLAIRSVA